jgi:hypothetical protein
MKFARWRRPIETREDLIGPEHRNEYNCTLNTLRTYPMKRLGKELTTTVDDKEVPMKVLRGLRWMGEFTPEALQREFETTSFYCHDPGQDALMTSVDRHGNASEITLDEWKQWTQRDEQAKQMDSLRKKQLDEKSLEERQAHWEEQSLKVADREEYIAAVKSRLIDWDKMWEQLHWMKFRSVAFKSKRLKQRALDKVAQRLVGNTNSREKYIPKVAFIGDLCLNASPKGTGPVPVITIREHAGKKGLVNLVDEFRTSSQCASCSNQNMGKMKHPEKRVPAWRCKECPEKFHKGDAADCMCKNGHARGTQLIDEYKIFICPRCEGRYNRDVNAANNMLCVVETYMQTGRRPAYLCRDAIRN